METQSESVKWNLISWSEHEPPIWLSHHCIEQATLAAQAAYPNETCGLFVNVEGSVRLHVFHGISTERSCLADENEVISFTYWLHEHSGIVLASFHSHPNGCAYPSQRDALLNVWAHHHVLHVRTGSSWVCKVFQS